MMLSNIYQKDWGSNLTLKGGTLPPLPLYSDPLQSQIMDAATLNEGIANGTFKVTRLAPAKPRKRDLIMTRVAAGKSFALPSYSSVRDSNRSTRATKDSGKRFAKTANRKVS